MSSLAIPLAIAGISGLGGLFSNRGGQTKTKSTTDSSQHTDTSTTPIYDPKMQALRDQMINAYMWRNENNEDFFGGYQRQGLADINKTADSSQRQMENALASRGISGGMAGSGLTAPLLARQQIVSGFMNQIPMLRDQREQQNLAAASSFLASLPKGTHTLGDQTGHSVTEGTQTTPSNMLGGLFGGLGTSLAGLYGDGAFGGGNKNAGGSSASVSSPTPSTPSVSNQWMSFPTFAPTTNPWNVAAAPSYATGLPQMYNTPYIANWDSNKY